MYYFLVVFFFIHSSSSLSIGRTPNPIVCQIDQQTDDNATLIVDKYFAYMDPSDATKYVTIDQNVGIYTTCPGGKLEYKKKFLPNNYLHVTCDSGNIFKDVSSSSTFDFSKLFCNVSQADRSTVEVKKTSSACAATMGQETQLGYNFKYLNKNKIVESRFAKLVTVCFDVNNRIPLYSSFTMNKSKRTEKVSFNREVKFSQKDSYFGEESAVNLADFYLIPKQQANFDRILGPSKIIITETNRLSKGHLTANADFPYKLQRDATFHYDNTAPQWLSFNSMNWGLLEKAVRDYVQDDTVTNRISKTVYTGTLDVATAKDVHGNRVPLYLDLTNKIPVPKWFWKLVDYSRTSNVTNYYIFFGYNDLYSGLTNKPDVEHELLTTVCRTQQALTTIPQMQTLVKNNNDLNRGYIFACYATEIIHPKLKAIIAEIKKTKKFYYWE